MDYLLNCIFRYPVDVLLVLASLFPEKLEYGVYLATQVDSSLFRFKYMRPLSTYDSAKPTQEYIDRLLSLKKAIDNIYGIKKEPRYA